MATKYPSAAGAWSTRTWKLDSDGTTTTAPTNSDLVLANGLAITLDQDISVLGLSTVAGTNAAAGGSFTNSTAGRSITLGASGVLAGTSNCLILTNTTGTTTVTSSGDIQGSTASAAIGLNCAGSGGTASITANAKGGGVNSAYGVNVGTMTVNLTGNVTGGSGSGLQCPGLAVTGGGVVTITGNVIGTVAGMALWVTTTNAAARLTVNGNITGGTASTANGLTNSGSSSSQQITINGTVTGGSHATAYGVISTSVCPIILNGQLNASATTPAVADSNASSASFTKITTGPIVNNGGINALFLAHVAISTGVQWTIDQSSANGSYSGTAVWSNGGGIFNRGMQGGFNA